MTTEPTYEDLKAERVREWQDAQRRAATELDALRDKLAKMPDVHAPASPWDTKGEIRCGCGGTTFTVHRWVSCNGRKYRTELACLGCRAVGTWDFVESRWL